MYAAFCTLHFVRNFVQLVLNHIELRKQCQILIVRATSPCSFSFHDFVHQH